jgi:anti-sigma regulatory factor (Ser/Thr protein kinase)
VIYEERLPGDISSIARARRLPPQLLEDLPSDVAQGLALVVTELASNVVRHARTDFTLRVERLKDLIRIEVIDDGPGEPIRMSPRLTDTAGRGLQIVGSLADEWGIEKSPDHPLTKTVWATIRFPEPEFETENKSSRFWRRRSNR